MVAEWRDANPERVHYSPAAYARQLERTRAYQKANREQINAQRRAYWQANAERLRERQRDYRARRKIAAWRKIMGKAA